MGQKINPKILRLGVIKDWNSRWYIRRNYAQYLREDLQIRKYLKTKLDKAGIDKVEIERPAQDEIQLIIHSAKPGLIISRGGAGIEELTRKLQKEVIKRKVNLKINIIEVKKPTLSAANMLQIIIQDIEKRVPYRRVIKSALRQIREAGAEGARVMVKGRLDGSEIARKEHLAYGKIPLQTLRADIDYTRGTAHTIYGTIGVKVWIYKGEVFK